MYAVKVLVVMFVLLCLGGCATSTDYVRPGTDFNKYKRIAVLPLVDFPSNPQSGIQVADMISMNLLSTDATILDRVQTSQLLSEQQFGTSGLVDENTVPRLGKILGVQALISGSVNEWQTTCQNIQVVRGADPAILCVSAARITLKLIDIETGQIIWSASARGSTVGINLEAIAAEKAVVKVVEQLRPRLQSQATAKIEKYSSEAATRNKQNSQLMNVSNERVCETDCLRMYKRGELRVTIEECIKVLCK
jgi:TolB-like protein